MIVVTGGSGFIGSAVVRRLLLAGHEVRLLTGFEGERPARRSLQVETVCADLGRLRSLEKALRGATALFHLAGEERPLPRHRLYDTNVRGTRNLMLAALEMGVGRIVHTSTAATLRRRPDSRPVNEADRGRLPEMHSHRLRSQFLGESEVRRLVRERSLPAVIVAPTTPLGPLDRTPSFAGRLLRQALRGRLLPYFDTVFNLVHVDDVAAGHLLAWERGRPGESYLLGGENVTVGGVLRLVAELAGGQAPLRLRLPPAVVLAAAWTAGLWGGITGREPPLSAAEVRQARQPVLYSSGRARQELGYHPRPLPETLADAIHWFRQEQENRLTPVRSRSLEAQRTQRKQF